MSNLDPIAAQPDWRDSYSQYLPAIEPSLPSFQHPTHAGSTESTGSAPISASRPSLLHRHNLAQAESRQSTFFPPQPERPDSAPSVTSPRQETSLETTSYLAPRGETVQRSSYSEVETANAIDENNNSNHQQQVEDEEEKDDDDDEMLDVEDIIPGEGRAPQTDAERRAERRKMKRFRLTHQQTRFLMSEFAKQAHPDAAHRERLSREIPGLSPRQVQVWFQNRRAKIKRLTADDRERMLKMRAVPPGFDNVQALHSSYGNYTGAGHNVGTSLQSAGEYSQSYDDQVLGLRPLMVDSIRRQEHNGNFSASGLASPFGYAPSNSSSTTDVISSFSPNERYFSSNLASPDGTGIRSLYGRHNSIDSYGLQAARQGVRPIQPLNMRDTLPRTRSDSLQSPLKTSVSWKGTSINYGSYQPSQTLSPLSSQQVPLYQGDQSGSVAGLQQQTQYTAGNYATLDAQSSPQTASYPGNTTQPENTNPPVPRFRSASVAFPSSLGQDLRSDYRGLTQQNPNQNTASTPSSSFAGAFNTGGFQRAPLMPPAEFQIPRTTVDANRNYHITQLSAPMSAPQDFSSAYQQASDNGQNNGHEQQGQDNQQHALAIPADNQHQEHTAQPSQPQSEQYARDDGYTMDPGTQSRKRAFRMYDAYEGS